MVNKEVTSKNLFLPFKIIKRFPYVACDMLASETDYVLQCFFPEPNLENLEVEDNDLDKKYDLDKFNSLD